MKQELEMQDSQLLEAPGGAPQEEELELVEQREQETKMTVRNQKQMWKQTARLHYGKRRGQQKEIVQAGKKSTQILNLWEQQQQEQEQIQAEHWERADVRQHAEDGDG